jgi:hypothetical protein
MNMHISSVAAVSAAVRHEAALFSSIPLEPPLLQAVCGVRRSCGRRK